MQQQTISHELRHIYQITILFLRNLCHTYVLITLLDTAWKESKYGVISGPYFAVFDLNTVKYGPEITPYLDSFHVVIQLGKDTLPNPANIYLFKVNNRNIRKRPGICSKLTKKYQKDIIKVVLVSSLLTLT